MKIMAFAFPVMLLLAVVGADPPCSGSDCAPICNVETVTPGGPYASGIVNILFQLVYGVESNGDNYRLELSIAGGGAIYGQAFCSSKPSRGCSTCIEGLSAQLQDSCPNAIGAQVNWVGYCYLRYEAYPF